MSTSVDFHARAKSTKIKARIPKLDSKITSKHYGVLTFIDKGVEITIFLWSPELTRELLNAVRRIDRRLNPCQKQ